MFVWECTINDWTQRIPTAAGPRASRPLPTGAVPGLVVDMIDRIGAGSESLECRRWGTILLEGFSAAPPRGTDTSQWGLDRYVSIPDIQVVIAR